MAKKDPGAGSWAGPGPGWVVLAGRGAEWVWSSAPRVPRVFQPPMAQPRSARLPVESGRAAPTRTRAGSTKIRRSTRDGAGEDRMDRRRRRVRQRRSRSRMYSGSRSRIKQTFSNENKDPGSLLSIHCSASQRKRRGGNRPWAPRSARHATASTSIAKASLTSQREENCRGATSAGWGDESPCRVMSVSLQVTDLVGH